MRHLLLLLVLGGCTANATAGDWYSWRGPEQNGVSRERDLPDTFSLNPKAKDSNVLWRVPYGGISTPIVMDGQVYVIYKTGAGSTMQESVRAFDADSGKKLWEHKFNVFLTGIVDDRVGWTHMVGDPETGYVYAHGTQGLLTCFDKKGKIIWQRSLTEEVGRGSGYGGRLVSPIVDGDLLILGLVNGSWGEFTIGVSRFVAFDKRKGQVVWWGETGYRFLDTWYSTPVVAVINGQRLLISGTGDGGVHAFQVRTGKKVWSYIFGHGAVNCAPVVKGDLIFIGHGEENPGETQGRIICVDGSKITDGQPKRVWQKDGIKVKYASPILHEDRLYVCDEVGKMYCLDIKDGKEIWNFVYGANTKGSPVWADGKIYVTEVDSRFHILKPGKDSCERLARVFFRTKGVAPIELNGDPAVANGKVYFSTTTELICIGKKGHKAKTDLIPPEPAEKPADKTGKPAQLQVVPADVAINPGDSVSFTVRSFDAEGRLLGEVKADWSLAGMLPPRFPIGMEAPKPSGKPAAPPTLAGTLSGKSGSSVTFTASKAMPGQFGRVMASMGGLTAAARVRVAPVLPIAMDFKKVPDGRTPGGWVNTMGKFSVITLKDGTKVLSKRNDSSSPPVARANAYMGLHHLTDYTVESDVYGIRAGKNLPDIGIGANRYTLMLAGNAQTLRLTTWDAQKRLIERTDFTWDEKVWYRMKITVKVDGNKATVRGKIWPRNKPEPEKWALEVVDPVANKEGSPFLYGYVGVGAISPKNPGPGIYYSNVRVTPNK
jgi:outer membrane protein assembly factor BamB